MAPPDRRPTVPSEAYSEALAALTRFLVTDVSVADTLVQNTEVTISAMPAAEVAGITMLRDDGRPITGIFTDPLSPEIDAAQYQSGQGPCLDAWRQRRVVRLDDLADEIDRY